MDLGNVLRAQRDQGGSSKEAKNRELRTEKFGGLDLLLSIGETGTLGLQLFLLGWLDFFGCCFRRGCC